MFFCPYNKLVGIIRVGRNSPPEPLQNKPLPLRSKSSVSCWFILQDPSGPTPPPPPPGAAAADVDVAGAPPGVRLQLRLERPRLRRGDPRPQRGVRAAGRPELRPVCAGARRRNGPALLFNSVTGGCGLRFHRRVSWAGKGGLAGLLCLCGQK